MTTHAVYAIKSLIGTEISNNGFDELVSILNAEVGNTSLIEGKYQNPVIVIKNVNYTQEEITNKVANAVYMYMEQLDIDIQVDPSLYKHVFNITRTSADNSTYILNS